MLLRSNIYSFPQYFFYLLLDFHVKAGTRFSLRDKWLFEISEVEITRVNCIMIQNEQFDSLRLTIIATHLKLVLYLHILA